MPAHLSAEEGFTTRRKVEMRDRRSTRRPRRNSPFFPSSPTKHTEDVLLYSQINTNPLTLQLTLRHVSQSIQTVLELRQNRIILPEVNLRVRISRVPLDTQRRLSVPCLGRSRVVVASVTDERARRIRSSSQLKAKRARERDEEGDSHATQAWLVAVEEGS